MNDNKLTILYERLSHEDGRENESLSIEHQKEYLEEYAARNGFTNARPSPPPTGTSRPRPRNGGRRGRSFATGRWSSTDTTSASTTAVMSGRA